MGSARTTGRARRRLRYVSRSEAMMVPRVHGRGKWVAYTPAIMTWREALAVVALIIGTVAFEAWYILLPR